MSALSPKPDPMQPATAVALAPLSQPVRATVDVPGSKSYTIRALMLAAMAATDHGGTVEVAAPLFSDDTEAMMACLNTLGMRTERRDGNGQSVIAVAGNLKAIEEKDYTLDANLSAATLRFLLALSAVIPGRQTLLGKEGLNQRPVQDLVDSLQALGASIEYLNREGYPPVRVSSGRLCARRVQVAGHTSSQYLSALMMIAPWLEAIDADPGAPVRIELPETPVSKPYLDMTAAIMDAFGVNVVNEDYRRFLIPAGQRYRASRYVVEPDASSMAYFLAIAALTGVSVAIPNLNPASVQADLRLIDILRQMGNEIRWDGDRLTVVGRGVAPLRVDMRDCPDQAQTVAVLAAFADGATRIDGLQSLRVKETDRLAAVVRELRKMGIRTEEEADALVIYGGVPQPALIETYGDHRMAMAFAVAGAKLAGLRIADPTVVNKTYPQFWRDLERLGVGVTPIAETVPASAASPGKMGGKIVLIGFMGAGKSAVAALLAEKLRLPCVEMDALILAQSGRASITEIFERDGEPHFRELELNVARSLQGLTHGIISTGGGVVMNPAVMSALQEGGTVVFLKTLLETALARLRSETDRPLLQDPHTTAALYQTRLPLYRHYAQRSFATDDRLPPALADEIIETLGVAPACPV